MNFNDQEAVITYAGTFGKNLKKYMPLFNKNASKEAQAVLISEETVLAFSVSYQIDKLFDIVLNNLSEKERNELEKSAAMLGGIDKLKNMFTGEFAFSLVPSTDEIGGMEYNAFIGLNDKKQLQTLIDGLGGLFLGIKKENDEYYMDEYAAAFADKGFVFSSNRKNLKVLKNGKGNVSKTFV
jgi:hypothetical protein